MAIQKIKSKVGKERSRLKAYQSGKIQVLKTGRPHIDDTLTGLLPGDIVVIGGASGAGKSFELQTIRENIMDINRNPGAGEYVFLDYSFEMKLFNLILRGLNKVLNKSKKNILLNEFSDYEKSLANRYIGTMMDDRYYIEENPLTPKQFYEQTRQFLMENKDKKGVIIAIDHIALFKNDGDQKKGAVDAAVEYINLLKREFGNTYFLILTQLNRTVLGRTADKDLNAQPNRGDIYQSDTMFHIADYLIVVHNPYRLGINQYSKVNPDHYNYLSDFFCETEGISKKVSFETLGNIFYHVLKVREGEVVFRDIYIEEVLSENLEMYKTEKIDVTDENPEDDFDNLDFEDMDNKF